MDISTSTRTGRARALLLLQNDGAIVPSFWKGNMPITTPGNLLSGRIMSIKELRRLRRFHQRAMELYKRYARGCGDRNNRAYLLRQAECRRKLAEKYNRELRYQAELAWELECERNMV